MARPMPTYAYKLASFQHQNSTIYYYYDNWVESRARSFFSVGASAWKDKTTQAVIKRYTSNYSDTGYVKSQTVILNLSSLSWSDDGALKSVVVHEMGHVFGLNDNGTTRTIMNAYTYGTNSRYGYFGLTTPQTDDVIGVNVIY